MQTTLKTPISLDGVGLHTGRLARMRLSPAAANYGIWFRRIDAAPGEDLIEANWSTVVPSELCTMVMNDAGVSVSTIEHVMAAIAGTGLHNVLVEVDGPEIPILDGSAVAIVRAILTSGLRSLSMHPRAIKVRKPVEIARGDATARLEPSSGFEIDFSIDFADAAIGKQTLELDMANGTFVHELCDSRTFCLKTEVDAMHARGLALGGSLENAVVYDAGEVLNPEGLRHSDEAVRHKMLDVVGDLALAGGPIIGRYIGAKAGHATTRALLAELFADPSAYQIIDCVGAQAARLPGAGLTASDFPKAA
ncbi:MAG: UDP-3-O-acyl-N-acetylglucosamine deacetylase [Pseudomonadota bacterium]